ncbi:MAG: c-type cytochrome [Dechloromonas sp.]|uniref:c-type cytochrome n=1 Tax=Azonexaceae TaxID=2008795 RepID=UPI001CF7EFFF|nr:MULTISPECIES: c-type cytochrome [Azonexaceae]MBT9523090.1 c-type cytochrome [Dechloromonas sp.]UCV24019.1 c-type cytochrome [Ferribacterium limneticum]
MSLLRQLIITAALAAAAQTAWADAANDEKMKKLAAHAGCFTCHTLEHKDNPDGSKPIGPAWKDVSEQYRGKPGATDFLTRVVQEGSNPYSSHWKNKVTGIAMPPNAVAISANDTRQLVSWILSLK